MSNPSISEIMGYPLGTVVPSIKGWVFDVDVSKSGSGAYGNWYLLKFAISFDSSSLYCAKFFKSEEERAKYADIEEEDVELVNWTTENKNGYFQMAGKGKSKIIVMDYGQRDSMGAPTFEKPIPSATNIAARQPKFTKKSPAPTENFKTYYDKTFDELAFMMKTEPNGAIRGHIENMIKAIVQLKQFRILVDSITDLRTTMNNNTQDIIDAIKSTKKKTTKKEGSKNGK